MEGGKLMKMSRVPSFFEFHFLIPLGSTQWTIFTGKSIFHAGKKSGKVTLPPLKKLL